MHDIDDDDELLPAREPDALYNYKTDTLLKDFLRDVFIQTMGRNGLEVRGAMTYGGCVYHYTVHINRIDVPGDNYEETLH